MPAPCQLELELENCGTRISQLASVQALRTEVDPDWIHKSLFVTATVPVHHLSSEDASSCTLNREKKKKKKQTRIRQKKFPFVVPGFILPSMMANEIEERRRLEKHVLDLDEVTDKARKLVTDDDESFISDELDFLATVGVQALLSDDTLDFTNKLENQNIKLAQLFLCVN